MSAPTSSAAAQQREVDRQLQQPGASSSQPKPTGVASLPPRPPLPAKPQQLPQHGQQQHKPFSSQSQPYVPHRTPTAANSSVLPPLSSSQRASASYASRVSPKQAFRSPATTAVPIPRQFVTSTASNGTPTPTPAPVPNGVANRPSQPLPNTGASTSQAPAAAAQPTTSQTAPVVTVSRTQTPVPVPVPPPVPTPVPVPVPGDTPKPKPTYKMKRTGKPGMPPGIPLNISISARSSPSISPSSMTPPPAHLGPYAQSRLQPPKPAASPSYGDNPLPTAITSDIAPSSSSLPRPGTNISSIRPPLAGTSTLAATTSQSKVGDKRRNSTSPDVLQGHAHASSKRARVEAAAEVIPSDSDDLDLDSDVDSDDDSASESEDAADGEGSDDSSDEDDEDVDIESDESSSLASGPYTTVGQKAIGALSDPDEDSSSSEDPIPAALPAALPTVASAAAPIKTAAGLPRTMKKKKAPKKRKGRIPRSLARHRPAMNGAIPIFKTPSGRLYTTWTNKFGVAESASGALIPDGYKLHSDPQYPWVCPIRSCRVTFTQLSGLGHHFPRGHSATHLNDNLDGTLTIIKDLSSTQSGGARIVSQKKLADPGPLLETRLKRGEKSTGQTLSSAKMHGRGSLPAARKVLAATNDGYSSSSSEFSSADSMPPLSQKYAPKAAPAPKGPSSELLVSASGRAYTLTIDGSPAHGVAFPDGYKQSTYPGHPWVCPVRSCRRVLKAVHNLGGHYSRQHRNHLLNENNDGTHSIVGEYNGRRPLVVSHHRIPIIELEPLAEEMPAGVTVTRPSLGTGTPSTEKMQDANESLLEDQSALMDIDEPPLANSGARIPGRHPAQPQHEDLPTPIPGNSKAIWSYIEPVLKRTSSQAVLKKSYMHLFLEMPRKRDIHWNTPWIAQNPYLDSQPRDIASLVVHLTGDYAEVPCNHCKLGKGPYSGCIIVSSKAGPGLAAAFESCANCLYHCGHSYCSIKNTFKPRFASFFPDIDFDATRRYVRSGVFSKDLAKGGVPEADRSLMAFASKQSVDEAILAAREEDKKRHRKHRFPLPPGLENRRPTSSHGPTAAAAERQREKEVRAELKRRSDRIAFKDVTESATTPVQQESITPVPLPQAPGGDTTSNAFDNGTESRVTAMATSTTLSSATVYGNAAKPDSPFILQGMPQTASEVLDMEEWEVAPGRIISGSRTHAYSGAYLTNARMAHWNHDVSLRVEIVQPGVHKEFEPEAKMYRTCIIADGKLRVKVGGKEMVIGPKGAFEVLPSEEFSVANYIYVNATMFISGYRK